MAEMCLVIQIITGIFPTVHYTPRVDLVVRSVKHIMRDTNSDWLIKVSYTLIEHQSFLLLSIVMFLEAFVCILEVNYRRRPFNFLLITTTAFTSCVLPWRRMSF
jgi:ubiquinol-cytochrome c reductase cytochrome b subunit